MDAASYAWVEDPERCALSEAGCITVVLGADVPAVVSAFGGDPAAPPLRRTDLLGLPSMTKVAGIGMVGAAVVAVEWNGFEGQRIEVLRVVSASELTVSVFWNVNARMTFSLAVAGELVTAFDPMFPDPRWGHEPDRLAELMEGLPFHPHGQPVPAAMALAERVTGVALTPAELEAIDDAWILVPVLEDLPTLAYARRLLAEHDPRLVELIEGAPRERLRALAASTARAAATSTGLADDARIASALDRLDTSPGAQLPADAAELVRQLSARADVLSGEDPAHRERTTRRASERTCAAATLRAATNPDPLAAAIHAVDNARFTFPREPDAREDAVRTLLDAA